MIPQVLFCFLSLKERDIIVLILPMQEKSRESDCSIQPVTEQVLKYTDKKKEKEKKKN